jgi:hypothetical protein
MPTRVAGDETQLHMDLWAQKQDIWTPEASLLEDGTLAFGKSKPKIVGFGHLYHHAEKTELR